MKEFRRGDVVLVAGTVVDGDDDTIRVTINGTEVVVSIGEATISRRSFHPGDAVTSSHEDAKIIQTIEPGVHLVHIEGRTGAQAYQVVDESVLAHREAAEKSGEQTGGTETAGQDAGQRDRETSGDEKGDATAPALRFAFERPGAAPTFADRGVEGGEAHAPAEHDEAPLELGGHEVAGDEAHGGGDHAADRDISGIAGDLASSLDDGARSPAVDIDLEEIGVTEHFRPVSERDAGEA